jgi:hypothetical protein
MILALLWYKMIRKLMKKSTRLPQTNLFDQTKNVAHIYLKTKDIMNTFNNKISIRNILIVTAMCFIYLLGKHFQAAHKPIIYTITKTRYIKTN